MLWIILSAICLAIVLLALLPIRFRVEYAYSYNAKQQRLTLFVNGMKVFVSDLKKAKTETPKQKSERKEMKFDGFMHKIRTMENLLEQIKPDIEKLLSYLKNKLCIKRYILHFDLGFEDAAQTGVASGAAYALVYGASALVYNNLNLQKRDMDIAVTPQFHKPCIDFYFDGIFRLRIAHIIKAAVKVLKLFIKSKNILNTNEGGVLV